MHSLFWKIFLWFWLAMTFVIAATAFVSFTVRPSADNAPLVARTTRWRFVANTSFAQWAHAQAAAWERGGLPKTPPDDIVSWLLDDVEGDQNAPQADAEWWIFSTDGKLLSHQNGDLASAKNSTNEAQTLSKQAAKTDRVVASRPEILAVPDEKNPGNENAEKPTVQETLLASSTRTPLGKTVVFVARLPLPAPLRPAPSPDATARRAFPLAFFFLRGEPLTRTLRLLTMLLTTSLFCLWLARHVTRPVRQLRATVHELSSGNLAARSDRRVTARNDELGDLGRDFDAMAGRLDKLMTAQRRLVSDVSHELRSPLARLGIALELARRHSSDEALNATSSIRSASETLLPTGAKTASAFPLQSALSRIEREANRLEEMVAQLLMLSRLESGAALDHTEEFDILEIVRDVANDGRFEAQSRGVEVELVQNELVQNELNEICGSRSLLRSGLENVLRNAIRFAPDETKVQIEIEVQKRATQKRAKQKIVASANRNDDVNSPITASEIRNANSLVTIRVLDAGPGVPEDTSQKLFQPFYRVEDARDRQSGGTGLGLAIAERAVHLHGGTIRAFNRETGGLCVEISLPLNTPIQNYEK